MPFARVLDALPPLSSASCGEVRRAAGLLPTEMGLVVDDRFFKRKEITILTDGTYVKGNYPKLSPRKGKKADNLRGCRLFVA